MRLDGLSRDHYWRGGIELIHEFLNFGVYLNEFLIFLHEIFLVVRSYRVLDINIKFLIMGALFTLKTRLKDPFLPFFDDFGHFSSCLF